MQRQRCHGRFWAGKFWGAPGSVQGTNGSSFLFEAVRLKKLLLTHALDFQENVGLVQRVPKMIDIYPCPKSQLYDTCVSFGGSLVNFWMKAEVLFSFDMGQVGDSWLALVGHLIVYNK